MSLPDVNELKEQIGQTGSMMVGGTLFMAVKVVDARTRFGRVDYRVVPLEDGGKGWTWIASTRFIRDADSRGDQT